MILGASWTANFTGWDRFANWANNSNFASLLFGIALPGIVVGLITYFWKVHPHFKRIHERNEWADRLAARAHKMTTGEDPPDHPHHGKLT